MRVPLAAGAHSTRRPAQRVPLRWRTLSQAEVQAEISRLGGRWQACMLAGDFESAWRQSDTLRARHAPDPHRFWDGEALDGKRVIVRCLHGFGDAVQMLGYAPRLAQMAAQVIYEVAPHFVPLARCCRGVHRVITWGDGAPSEPPGWDSQVEVMELPYLFRTTITELPVATCYIQVPEGAMVRVSRPMQSQARPRIGFAWTAGEWNAARSLPFSLLSELLSLDGVSFWNLQGGAAAREAPEIVRRAPGVCDQGLIELAAGIASLDLVITVDTLVAHLAGALGKPVWVMLQHAADWRWMASRADSPWYPTMRLFRQPTPGDWQSVVAAIRQALVSQFL